MIADVIERMAAAQMGFKTIDGIEALAELAETPIAAFPAAFVVPAAEGFTAEQEGAGLIVVRSDYDFDVAIIVNSSAARGKAKSEVMALAADVVAVLLGWTPDASIYRPIKPLSARLLGLSPGRISWVVRFRTSYRLRKQG